MEAVPHTDAIGGRQQYVDWNPNSEFRDETREFDDDYGPGKLQPIHFGDTLDGSRYKILRKLGAGSFSTVWLARDHKSDIPRAQGRNNINHSRATRMNTYVAVKIMTANSSTTEQESSILEHLTRGDDQRPGKKHVMTLLDSFAHHGPNGVHRCLVFDVMGPSTSTMFEHLPPSLKGPGGEPKDLAGGENFDRCADDRGRYPLWMAKSILRQTLLGIDFLHNNGIAHGDLQPGNILFSVKDLSSVSENQLAQVDNEGLDFVKIVDSDGRVQFHRPSESDQLEDAALKSEATFDVDGKHIPSVPRYIVTKQPMFDYMDLDPPISVKISDLGGAFFTSKPPVKPVTPLALRSPELILGEPITKAQDIWSFGCLIFEYVTGTMLFSVMPPFPGMNEDQELKFLGEEDKSRANCDGDTDSEDSKSSDKQVKEVSEREHGTNDADEGYAAGTDDETDDDHILQLADTLGPLPPDFLARYPRSRIYFNEQGETTRHHIGNLVEGQDPNDIEALPPLEAFLDQEKAADLSEDEALVIKKLLRLILQFDSARRPSASELLKHPWFAEPGLTAHLNIGSSVV